LNLIFTLVVINCK